MKYYEHIQNNVKIPAESQNLKISISNKASNRQTIKLHNH